jgi:transposase InsO family protein
MAHPTTFLEYPSTSTDSEEVMSRECLSVSVTHQLRQDRATLALQEGRQALIPHGIPEPLMMQSDAGPDFTSTYF